MKQFKQGDQVMIVRSPHPCFIGQVTTVVSGPTRYPWLDEWEPHVPPDTEFYEVAIRSVEDPEGYVSFPPSHLIPIDDDSSTKTTWDSLPSWARKACERKESA